MTTTAISIEEAELLLPTARVSRNAVTSVAGSTQRKFGADPNYPSPLEHRLTLWNSIIRKLGDIIHYNHQ